MQNVMTSDHSQLLRLLRAELTAVHQQFFHILILRSLGENQLAARIVAVDDEDFKNAMQIIDLLAHHEVPVTLEPHHCVPRAEVKAILESEHAMEMHLADVLAGLDICDPQAKARVDRAAAPRAAYKSWLETRVKSYSSAEQISESRQAVTDLFSHLLVLIEQSLVHAFVRWHQGDPKGADSAWQISGAAMLYATALVRRTAQNCRMPKRIMIPALAFSATAPDAFQLDLELVQQCGGAARLVAEEGEDEALSQLCLQIAEDCERIVVMKRGQEFPAKLGKSAAFSNFAKSRERVHC